MMGKTHVYMRLHAASVILTAGNITRRFPSPFHLPTSSRFSLAGAFRNDHAAACRIALRSATG